MKRYAIFIILLVGAWSIQIFSQPQEERFLHRAIEKLNLSDQQQKDVEKIHVDMQKQTIAQKAKLATAKVELQQLLKTDAPDKSVIEKKMSEMADLGVQLHMIKINSWFAVNKLLTPEQQKSWKIVLEKGPAMRRDRMLRGLRERSFTPQPGRQILEEF